MIFPIGTLLPKQGEYYETQSLGPLNISKISKSKGYMIKMMHERHVILLAKQ